MTECTFNALAFLLNITAVLRQKEASHIEFMKKMEVKHLKLRRGFVFITFARTCFLLHPSNLLASSCLFWQVEFAATCLSLASNTSWVILRKFDLQSQVICLI